MRMSAVSGSRVSPSGARLSDGDVRILGALAGGRPPEAIARELGMSERTLRRRVRGVCDALEVKTSIEAVVWAVRRDLI